ncbi:thiosulfate oxidation carrier protein SoxY [Blastochloris tepida]|nr:thiosulfate oxidation carrier protein SoxY [Blastochloris tepida]
MRQGRTTTMLGRRALLRAGGGLVMVSLLTPAEAGPPAEIESAIRALIGDASPQDGGIALQTPATAENGAVVPLTIAVDSPMTDADFVRAIHVLATRNPTPGVASYHLTPASGKAVVSVRIRLAEKQTILVLAEHSDGRVTRAQAEIAVSVGGCLT